MSLPAGQGGGVVSLASPSFHALACAGHGGRVPSRLARALEKTRNLVILANAV